MPNVKDKALTLEDLKEALVQTGNALPAISSSDEGKIMRVDSEGNWSAEELPVYSGESGGGESNTLTSDFLTIHKETVTIGENTISKSSQYQSYLDSIKSIPGVIIAMSIHKKNSYVYNEFANGLNSNQVGYRYRNGWSTASWNHSSYDAAVPAGTLVDIYTVELKNPVNV